MPIPHLLPPEELLTGAKSLPATTDPQVMRAVVLELAECPDHGKAHLRIACADELQQLWDRRTVLDLAEGPRSHRGDGGHPVVESTLKGGNCVMMIAVAGG